MHLKQKVIYTLLLSSAFCFFACEVSHAQLVESSKPASTNITQTNCPCILEDLRVVFRIKAPEANKVQIDLGRLYDMNKDDQGIWSVTTDPQVPGFHYYSLVIDGVKVADPASESFYGMGRMASAIDIPEKGVDFYEIKDVPHGTISSKYYFSKVTNSWRRLFVYTPAGYETDAKDRLLCRSILLSRAFRLSLRAHLPHVLQVPGRVHVRELLGHAPLDLFR